MHMIAPVSEGTLSVVWVISSIQQIPAKRARQRGDDDEGIEPGLKVHHDQQIASTIAPSKPKPRPVNERLHGLHLAAHVDVRTARHVLLRVLHEFFYLVGDSAKIAP